MISEQDILNAIKETIEEMRKYPIPPPKIQLTPEQFETLRNLPVKTIPMDAANQIFAVPFVVKDELVPEHLFGTNCSPAFIDEEYGAGDS